MLRGLLVSGRLGAVMKSFGARDELNWQSLSSMTFAILHRQSRKLMPPGIRADDLAKGVAVVDTIKSDASRTSETSRRIALLGAPIDIGASQRGTLMGPAALRTAGLLTLLG